MYLSIYLDSFDSRSFLLNHLSERSIGPAYREVKEGSQTETALSYFSAKLSAKVSSFTSNPPASCLLLRLLLLLLSSAYWPAFTHGSHQTGLFGLLLACCWLLLAVSCSLTSSSSWVGAF